MEIYRLSEIKMAFDFRGRKNEENKDLPFWYKYEKYKTLLDAVPNQLLAWHEQHLSSIGTKQITSNMIRDEKIPCNKNDKYAVLKAKRFLADSYAQDIEQIRFFNHKLGSFLDEIDNCLSDFSLSREEKKNRLEKLYFLYDVFRVIGRGGPSVKEKLKYIDKNGTRIDISEEQDKLYSFTIPDDFRACRMFFDMYRICGDSTKPYWGFYYCYFYINRLFEVTDFDNIGYAMFPFLYLSDENNKMPIATIIAIVDDALKNALERLNDRILQIDASIYESYKVNTHLVLNAPFVRNCQAEGIVRNTDPSYNRTKNMVYALARSLDSVDLIIENLHLLLTNNDVIIRDEKQELMERCSSLEHTRSEILFKTYRYSTTYHEGHDKYSLPRILDSEASISAQFKLCDRFSRISKLATIDSLDLLMSEKKEIAEELNSALVNSSESPYIIEKLQQKLDETVQRIHEDIIESKLAELFTKQIDAYFSELGFAVDIDVDSGMIMLLSSAEYLYDKYIIHSTENPSLDYSFIAILYYKALESLINNRLYRPFVKSFSFDRNGEKREIEKNEFSRYFDSASYRSLTKNKFMKESLEMGTIAYVLSNTDSFTTEMKNYLFHALVPDDYLYAIKDYMERLKQLSKNRNNAAHGTKTITFRDAKQAKGETFIISDTAVDEYRGMIVELMGMLKCYSKTDS